MDQNEHPAASRRGFLRSGGIAALFGATAADAFGVSVTVDTDTDASTATVNADVWVRTSPYGATINLNLTHRLEV